MIIIEPIRLSRNCNFAELSNDSKTMKERIAFITGANKGIGFGIAKHLGLSGWRIIVGARNQVRAEEAISKLTALGVEVPGWVHIELADLASVEQAARELNEQYPELSLLINNAGIPGDMSVDSQHTELRITSTPALTTASTSLWP